MLSVLRLSNDRECGANVDRSAFGTVDNLTRIKPHERSNCHPYCTSRRGSTGRDIPAAETPGARTDQRLPCIESSPVQYHFGDFPGDDDRARFWPGWARFYFCLVELRRSGLTGHLRLSVKFFSPH